MEQLAYSSTAAFLAHYRLLNTAASGGVHPLSGREHETLNAMHHVMEALTPDDRALLLADAAKGDEEYPSSDEHRRRERTQLKLRRILLDQGVLRG